jgi:hypothetical protein
MLSSGLQQLPAQTAESLYAAAIEQHREEYKGEFLTDPRSPLSEEDLPLLRFYPPDQRYQLTCRFIRTPEEKPFDLPTYSGITRPYVKYGILQFEWEGSSYQLAVYQNLALRQLPQYAQYLFLPFRDPTNGETTYGGGRYIDLQMPASGTEILQIDFNKCYNPWCHYSDGFNCPIPPTENHLTFPILAGEMMWAGETKH